MDGKAPEPATVWAFPRDRGWRYPSCCRVHRLSYRRQCRLKCGSKSLPCSDEGVFKLRAIPHVVRPRGMIPLGTPISEHQGLCPCHPALAAEGSGARGGGAAPHSPAEAVQGRGLKRALCPCVRSPERCSRSDEPGARRLTRKRRRRWPPAGVIEIDGSTSCSPARPCRRSPLISENQVAVRTH